MNPRPSTSSRRARRAAAGLTATLVAGMSALNSVPSPAAVPDPIIEAPAVVETTPSDVSGSDSIDDPAIWVDPVDPTRSVVIGADHADGSLTVYDLAGERLQRLQRDRANNVDLRPGFPLGGATVPVLGVAGGHRVSFFTLDPATRRLANVTAGGEHLNVTGAHGLCLYRSSLTGRFYAFVTSNQTDTITQYELNGDSGMVAAQLVRTIDIHPRVPDGRDAPLEGCVTDDAGRSLFVGEHDWHIWRYGAEPTDPGGTGDRVMVDSTLPEGGHFDPDVEGMTVVEMPGGERFLVASSQGDDTFTVYRATAPYEFFRKVKVVASATADGCNRTDGIDAVAVNLGPSFPQGIFVCQDNQNTAPGPGAMNFKFVRLETVLPLGPATTPTPEPQPLPQPQPEPRPQPEPPAEPGPPAAPAAARSGYWMLGARGDVFAFGDARVYGETPVHPPASAVDIAPTPSGEGYWVITDRGAIGAHGDAIHHGAPATTQLGAGETVTSLSPTPTGRGYWVFTTLGRAFAYGDAVHLGDMAGTRLNGPVLDSIPTPSGNGYYMVASDGGIFSFGDARFLGSMGGTQLNEPVQSLVPDPDGTGYWLVASDGGVFAFEAPFRGSMGGTRLNKPVTGMVPLGNGYLMVAEDGGIFNFSDKPFHGSLGANPPADPITSTAALG